jgi:hypothetical protein
MRVTQMLKPTFALVLLLAASGQAGPVPAFENYPVPVEVVAKTHLDLKSHPEAHRYRTRLREAVEKGQKFAGHYIVARWGCGSSCEEFAFIDAISGKVYFPGTAFYPVWGEGCPDRYGLEFQPDSSLLVMYGSPNEDSEAGTYYYTWSHEELRQITHVAGCPKK